MRPSRRALLIAGGVLGGGLALGVGAVGAGVGYVNLIDQRARQRDGLEASAAPMVAQWILIGPEGHVTVLSPHTEMGQGAQTGLLQIVVDELDADPERSSVQLAPAEPAFANGSPIEGFILGNDPRSGMMRRLIENGMLDLANLMNVQITGGSTSIRFTGWMNMRRAAACAREMLATAGAAQLGVAVDEVQTERGAVVHAGSGRRVDYGELAEAAAKLTMPSEPRFKDPSRYTLIGKPHPRVDLPDKIFAKAVYGIDVEVPGMRYAAVAPNPIRVGSEVTTIHNRDALLARRGVEAVIALPDGVAVVADNPWRAEQAAKAAEFDVSEPEGGRLETAALEARKRAMVLEKSATNALSGGNVVEGEYAVPFLAHAPMEPMNGTVWEEDGVLHIATGVQAPLTVRAQIADAMGRSLDTVELHAHTMGGGFGRRGGTNSLASNWLIQAAKVQQQVGGAIKLTWSREADTRLSIFRPSDFAHIQAELGADGKPVAWRSTNYAKQVAEEEAHPVYDIPDVQIQSVSAEPALPFGFWRSVDASIHGFFIESFIDQLAQAANQDPVAYRLSLLGSKPRHARTLRKAAEMAGWKGRTDSREGAFGVAMVPSFGSICAMVAQVVMEGDTPRVRKVWAAVDCGLAINPNAVEAQIQGGLHYGLSAALYGEITLEDGKIQQSNFHDYRAVRFADAPRVEVAILESPGENVGGVGEVGTPPIAPAVANAIAALRERPTHLPLIG